MLRISRTYELSVSRESFAGSKWAQLWGISSTVSGIYDESCVLSENRSSGFVDYYNKRKLTKPENNKRLYLVRIRAAQVSHN